MDVNRCKWMYTDAYFTKVLPQDNNLSKCRTASEPNPRSKIVDLFKYIDLPTNTIAAPQNYSGENVKFG